MERKIISHRIGSILDDISRLSNALYAMDTTDIQRYPDNYEVLSTDAALRAEKIACRLRHLIYSSTTIRKGDYLTSAGIVHGIEVVYEDGVLEVTLPGLLPKRKQRQNTEFLLDPFYFSLEQYAKEHPMPHFSDCVVCFTQVYDQCLPTRRIRDYDNLEEKQLLDVLSTFVMADDRSGAHHHPWQEGSASRQNGLLQTPGSQVPAFLQSICPCTGMAPLGRRSRQNTAARAETGSCSKETGKAQSHQTGIPH